LQPRTASRRKAGFPAFWLQRNVISGLLWPISRLFALLARWRRARIAPQRLPVPVVVVGGITVGGAGKTPLTLHLVEALRQHGYAPGIISRGYGGAVSGEIEVHEGSSAGVVGDEPLLLRQRAGCPVFVGKDRVAAGRALLAAHPQVNLILCDDGLQHYRLARDFEIAVFDRRGLGNGWQLPAGPLREPVARLHEVDAVVLNDAPLAAIGMVGSPAAVFSMRLDGSMFFGLHDPARKLAAAGLHGRTLHAVAGIGEPQRFFDHLRALGLTFEAHAFPDHHAYTRSELDFGEGVILSTEKDAVKLRAVLPPEVETWVLPVSAVLSPGLDQLIVEKLHGRPPA
jgi:tetraacyldisaccharide 4'-kinase